MVATVHHVLNKLYRVFKSPTKDAITFLYFSFRAKDRITLEIAFLYLHVRHAGRMSA